MKRHGRIVFVINSLAGGGAERVMSVLLAGLKGHLSAFEVHLVLLDREQIHHPLPDYVRTHQLDGRGRLIRSVILLRTIVRGLSPRVVVSFLERSNVANVICGVLLRHPTIISERVHTSAHLGTGVGAAFKRLVVRMSYPRADRVIAVSNGIRDDLIANFAVPAGKVVVINNPVDHERILTLSRRGKSVITPAEYAVALGRLVPSKNFSMLIEALARVPDLNLVILGEGPERRDLEEKVRSLGLAGRVLMPGYVENPYPIIAEAAFLVSSSNVEGFPNALLEAMSLGRPVIATDCPTGPAEILSDNIQPEETGDIARKFGILVPPNRLEAMVQALRRMSDPEIRAVYSQKSLGRARSFDLSSACEKYIRAIDATLDDGGVTRSKT